MRGARKLIATTSVAFAALAGGPAAASGWFTHPASAPPRGSHMQSLDFTLTPLAYLQFCRRHPSECRTSGRETLVALDSRALSVLRHVNAAVNGSIVPQRRSGSEVIESWSVMPAAGDCNDYAVSKRHALVRRGFPRSALLLAAAVTPRGEGHLVLVVRTDHGDLVLDNLRQDIVSWDSTGYRWLKRESASDPMRWERLAQPAQARARLARLDAPAATFEIARLDPPEPPADAEPRRQAHASAAAPAHGDAPAERVASPDAARAPRRFAAGSPLRYAQMSMAHWSMVQFAYGPLPLASIASTVVQPRQSETGLAVASLRGTLSPDTKAL